MKYKCTILLLVISFTTFAQERIRLNTVLFETDNISIYVKDIKDERKEKSLGNVDNSSGKQSTVILNPNASKAIQEFMDVSFPFSKEATPIYIKIKALEIQQSQSAINTVTTRAYAHLIFFEKEENSLKEIFNINHYEDQIFDISNTSGIFESHEKNIRATLEYCMQLFVKNYKENKTSEKDTLEFRASKEPISLATVPKLGKWFDILTYKQLFSKNREGYNISYIGFSDSEDRFILPFVLSYSTYKIKPESLRNKGYKSVDYFALGAGFDGYFKMFPGVYVGLGIGVPIGVEVTRNTENRKRTNFLIGINAKQGIKLIPFKDFGIVMGANIFQQVQTSKVYKTDFGFELELGVNF
ncbi:hypothetical protein [Aquimarina algiphila]|uniref:hypothetical protein n=1 Tax=Aquimarina algiphila TaxID=2047982 RepID=UPI002490CC01|nr:hypothetical protein [Aquimarina algiphila]